MIRDNKKIKFKKPVTCSKRFSNEESTGEPEVELVSSVQSFCLRRSKKSKKRHREGYSSKVCNTCIIQ